MCDGYGIDADETWMHGEHGFIRPVMVFSVMK